MIGWWVPGIPILVLGQNNCVGRRVLGHERWLVVNCQPRRRFEYQGEVVACKCWYWRPIFRGTVAMTWALHRTWCMVAEMILFSHPLGRRTAKQWVLHLTQDLRSLWEHGHGQLSECLELSGVAKRSKNGARIKKEQHPGFQRGPPP